MYQKDFEEIILACDLDWNRFAEKTILITGATGLLGRTLTEAFILLNEKLHLDLKVVALVRNAGKAHALFKDQVEIVSGSVEEQICIDQSVDYIVHLAAPTASKDFVEKPVQVVRTMVLGTMNLLEFAQKKQVDKFVYLSTMEVYGYPEKGCRVSEDRFSVIQSTQVRSSYPLSKLMCENLCVDFFQEYGIPAVIGRLTQTFGPGVLKSDQRIFASLARCMMDHSTMVLKTMGKTERSYCYTVDAVAAILTLLLKGEAGQAYNIAAEETYCSIRDMAEGLGKTYGFDVEFQLENGQNSGFADTLFMDLDTSKLKGLGWTPRRTKIVELFEGICADWRDCPRE